MLTKHEANRKKLGGSAVDNAGSDENQTRSGTGGGCTDDEINTASTVYSRSGGHTQRGGDVFLSSKPQNVKVESEESDSQNREKIVQVHEMYLTYALHLL